MEDIGRLLRFVRCFRSPNKNARTNVRFALSPQIQMFGICRFCRRKDAVLNPNVGAASCFLSSFPEKKRRESWIKLRCLQIFPLTLWDPTTPSLKMLSKTILQRQQIHQKEQINELWDSVTLQWDLSPLNDPLYFWWYFWTLVFFRILP